MKKRLTSLALATVLCLSMLSGCGSSASTKSPTPASGGSTAPSAGSAAEPVKPISEYPIASEPITLTYWITLPAPVSKVISNLSENKAFQQMEKDTGVKIEFIHPAVGQEKEQFNLLMASGKLPDIIGAPNLYKGGEFQGMADGMFLDLTDMIPTYAPDYYAYIQKDETFFREISNDAGRIPAVYSYKVEGDSPFRRVILRQDVLDEIGVDVPLYLEDYEAMFDKMLAKGITPYSPTKKGYEEMFANLFDVHINDGQKFYKDLDDKVHFAPLEPGFKEYLTLMNKWYSKGYI
ncbi:MAG: extracellular solute-binding protein, partial [Angelakisella sp.]